MTDKDVNIHIKAKDADTAKRDIDRTAQATERLGKKTEQAGKKGARGTDALTRSTEKSKGAFGSFMAKIGAWAVTLVGIGAAIKVVTGALNANKQALSEHADVAVAQQQKLLRLQYLGDLFKERPELGKEVGVLSEFGRRPFEEVADAWYNLRSKGGALSQQQRDSIMREALEMGRTDPDLPLDTLIDMFSLYAKKTGVEDANRIQNVLQKTIKTAGGSGVDVARYMTRFLPIGMAGELTGPEAAGLWAHASTLEVDPSIATSGLRSVFLKLAGGATPETQKLMSTLGVKKDMGFLEKIEKLAEAKAAGQLSLGAAKQLVGDEGASMLLSLIADPEAIRATIAEVVGADRGDIDLTKTKIKELMGTDEVAKLEEDIRWVDIQIANVKGADIRALRWRKKLREREMSQRRRGDAEYFIKWDRWALEQLGGLGVDPNKVSDYVIGDPILEGGPPEPPPEPAGDSGKGWPDRWDDPAYDILYGPRTNLDEPADTAMVIGVYERLKSRRRTKVLREAMSLLTKPVVTNRDVRKARQLYYSVGASDKWLEGLEKGTETHLDWPSPPETEPEITPEPVPAGDISEGQSRVINYNENYDFSINLNPVAGNAEDRLIGPPFDMYA